MGEEETQGQQEDWSGGRKGERQAGHGQETSAGHQRNATAHLHPAPFLSKWHQMALKHLETPCRSSRRLLGCLSMPQASLEGCSPTLSTATSSQQSRKGRGRWSCPWGRGESLGLHDRTLRHSERAGPWHALLGATTRQLRFVGVRGRLGAQNARQVDTRSERRVGAGGAGSRRCFADARNVAIQYKTKQINTKQNNTIPCYNMT